MFFLTPWVQWYSRRRLQYRSNNKTIYQACSTYHITDIWSENLRNLSSLSPALPHNLFIESYHAPNNNNFLIKTLVDGGFEDLTPQPANTRHDIDYKNWRKALITVNTATAPHCTTPGSQPAKLRTWKPFLNNWIVSSQLRQQIKSSKNSSIK